MSEPGSPFTLTGRSALITGGSKGIGFAIAAQFARAGADLFLCSRGQERLDQAVGQLREIAPNVKIEATTADMARRDEAGRLGSQPLSASARSISS
jgi:short-subunit dehydrogenase